LIGHSGIASLPNPNDRVSLIERPLPGKGDAFTTTSATWLSYSDQWLKIFTTAFSKGATRPTGTVAIIDVFAAFTTAIVALANEDSAIVMVHLVEEALA
jgi:hypothetical protein